MSCTSTVQELASGYKLGKILNKLKLQPDFDQFDESGTPDAMINNFTRLQPTLKHLGIRFDGKKANALMCEEKGVAAQLVYDIRTVCPPRAFNVKDAVLLSLNSTLSPIRLEYLVTVIVLESATICLG